MLWPQWMQRRYLSFCAIIAIAVLSRVAFAAPPVANSRATEQKSLDDALLEDLDADLAKPPRPAKPAAKGAERAANADETPSGNAPRRHSLDDVLLDGLEGEDIARGRANENPLVRLNHRMKQVERRIAETHSDEKTQRLQAEITDDLNKLIEQLEQQCQQCKNPSSSPRQQQTDSSKPASKPSGEPGDKPARDSTARTKEREAAKADAARLQDRLKDVWGHLPPHLRQQMEQSANEEFLPKYETEISEYYRSLVGGKKERK